MRQVRPQKSVAVEKDLQSRYLAPNIAAFAALVRSGSVTAAAREMHLTQSALTQRLQKLEAEIGATLFIRDRNGISLTSAGDSLLQFARRSTGIAAETAGVLHGLGTKLSGEVRIAGYSSVTRSVIMPRLTKLCRNEPNIGVQIFARELADLVPMLLRHAVDFIVTTSPTFRSDLEAIEIGFEDNVLVYPESYRQSSDDLPWLDHDVDDQTTIAFLRLNKMPTAPLRRRFLDEIYAIIDGVALGWGRAVVSEHLVTGDERLRIDRKLKPLTIPIYLQFFRDELRTKLQTEIINALRG